MGSGCDGRVSNQAKSAIGMRIRGQVMGVEDLHGCAEYDQQQTEDSQDAFSEAP